MSDHPFDAATALSPLVPGQRFAAELTEDWSGSTAPHGGVLAAIAARAMEEALADSTLALRALTVHYLRRPDLGPLEAAVAIERRGQRTANLTARLMQRGEPTVLATGTFAAAWDGFLDWTTKPPEMTAAADAPVIELPLGRATFHDFIEMRLALGPNPLDDTSDSRINGGWLRFKTPRPSDALALTFFADAWFPPMTGRILNRARVSTLDLTVHFSQPLLSPLPAGPLRVRFETSHSAAGIFTEQGMIWGEDGELLAQVHQSALLTELPEGASQEWPESPPPGSNRQPPDYKFGRAH